MAPSRTARVSGPSTQTVSPPFSRNRPTRSADSTPGSLGAALEEAGYREVAEQSIQVSSRWDVTPEQFTELMVEMGGLDWLLSQMTQAQRVDVLRDITNHYRGYQVTRAVELPLSCVIATGIQTPE